MHKYIVLILVFLVWSSFSVYAEKVDEQPICSKIPYTNEQKARAMASFVGNTLCSMSDREIMTQGLMEADVVEARSFCEKTPSETYEYFLNELQRVSNPPPESYSCGGSAGIPNYYNLGLTSSSCSWHDTNPFLCRIEGEIACLWGCTNSDPSVGWHMKYFSSLNALQAEIINKGYHLVAGQYGGSYRRVLPYGHSYQVHQISGSSSTGTGTWHVEGPEPNTEPNWPGILGGMVSPKKLAMA